MAKVIWKYTWNGFATMETFSVPAGARLISAANQGNRLVVYAEFDSEVGFVRSEERTVAVVGTGHPFAPVRGYVARFLGTVLLRDGALVWHVYEIEVSGGGEKFNG